MSSDVFSSLEIDAIGEILNISLGASATAVSTMLSRRVDITTPKVQVLSLEDFEFTSLEPAVGVEITYVSGLQGSNIMLLKKHDVKVIVEILMGMEIPDDEFELNEMNVSAICEVMNQMMGSSSTALSEFLGEVVNISTPVSFEIKDEEEFKRDHFSDSEKMVVVRFQLKIENVMESEFMNVMPTYLAKKLVAAFGLTDDMILESEAAQPAPASQPAGGGVMSQDEIEKMLASSMVQSVPEPAQTGGSTVMSQEDIEKMLAGSVAPAPQQSPAGSSGVMTQDEIEKMLSGGSAPAPQPSAPSSGGVMSQDEIEKMLAGGVGAQPQMAPQSQMVQPQMMPQTQMMQPQMMPQTQMMQPQMMPQTQTMQPQMMPQNQMPPMQPYYTPQNVEPRMISVQPLVHEPLAGAKKALGEEKAENLNLIMGVPLEISVEIGRTKRLVKEILEFAQGSLVVLDKLAGEQVDLYVNGQCIAKGDVVVVDDNFGIRVTEIIKKPDIAGLEL